MSVTDGRRLRGVFERVGRPPRELLLFWAVVGLTFVGAKFAGVHVVQLFAGMVLEGTMPARSELMMAVPVFCAVIGEVVGFTIGAGALSSADQSRAAGTTGADGAMDGEPTEDDSDHPVALEPGTDDGIEVLTLPRDGVDPTATDRFVSAAERWQGISANPNVVDVETVEDGPQPHVEVRRYEDADPLYDQLSDLTREQKRTAVFGMCQAIQDAARYNISHHNLAPEHVWARLPESGTGPTPVEEGPFGTATADALRNAGFETLPDLRRATREQLLAVEGLSRRVAEEIDAATLQPESTPDALVAVGDWGLERIRREATGEDRVTPYCAPEQVSKMYGHPGSHTDVYRLGAVVYHVLTGEPPHDAEDDDLRSAILSGDVDPPSAVNSELPSAVDYPVMQALAVSPDDRQPSAAELLRHLRAAL